MNNVAEIEKLQDRIDQNRNQIEMLDSFYDVDAKQELRKQNRKLQTQLKEMEQES
ncbi:hypothetical protein [Virgibacillus sp. CBA3643]|uniref:hypothetical protein n=1 Tax=Virgibacillus sp. CBA3643 TaxID=2942278 RepID=UPI0035A2F4C5